jgi:hypothetical protein
LGNSKTIPRLQARILANPAPPKTQSTANRDKV